MRNCIPYIVGICSVASAGWVFAQDDTTTDRDKPRAERLAVMRSLAEQLSIVRDDNQVEVPLIEKHLMRCSDATRRYQDGTVWGFGTKGRPTAIFMIQTNDASTGHWWFSSASLATDPFRVTHNGRPVWNPRQEGVSFRVVDGAPAPARNKALRLVQMRSMAQRFTAHQFWNPDNQRYQLRLLRQPLYRYDDEQAGVIDGAIFSFVINVHPELLLVVEAVQGDDGDTWRYAFAKIGSAEFHAQLDEQPVYQSPRAPGVVGNIGGTYRLFNEVIEPLEE